MDEKRIKSALDSADKILDLSDEALSNLNSASRWGIFDMVGGEKVVSAVKRRKISKYRKNISKIDKEVRKLNKDLKALDLDSLSRLTKSHWGVIGHLIDIFSDNFIVDTVAQVDISKNKNELKDFIKDIKEVKKELKAL